MPEQKLPFNKVSNGLRRLDEADAPDSSHRPSDELVRGGLNADISRRRRSARSERRFAAKPRRHGRKMS